MFDFAPRLVGIIYNERAEKPASTHAFLQQCLNLERQLAACVIGNGLLQRGARIGLNQFLQRGAACGGELNSFRRERDLFRFRRGEKSLAPRIKCGSGSRQDCRRGIFCRRGSRLRVHRSGRDN